MIIDKEERLPRELLAFLHDPKTSLLIKGAPGTGKTILALELLRHFAQKGNAIYLSTRVSAEKLYGQYPWLKDTLPQERIIATKKKRAEKMVYPTRIKLLDLTLSGGAGFIRDVFEHAKGLEEPLIVADSWDGIAKELKEKVRIGIEKELVAGLEDMNGKVIFTSEEPEETTLDYLVDGVVTLHRAEIEGREIREIELNKLRGVERKQHKYLFTLRGGRYRYFEPAPFVPPPLEKRRLDPVFKDKNPQTVSTCVDGLDDLLGGGWRKGSVNLLEVNQNVGVDYFGLIVPQLISSVNGGRAVLVYPPGGQSGYVLGTAFMSGFVKPKNLDERVRFVQSKTSPRLREVPYVVHLDMSDPDRFEKEVSKLALELIRSSKDGVGIIAFGLDMLERELGPKAAMGFLNRISQAVKGGQLVLLLVLFEGQKLPRDVAHLADTYWKIVERNRVCLLYGVVPPTGAYVLRIGFPEGYPETRIIPIV
ncbi:MAG: RAD55 family ATPase [Candidatus Bathyarchaeia archaeon]